jgi:hypothetical protein
LTTRGTVRLAALLTITLIAACGDDDDAQPKKNGGGSGSNSDGGNAGADGGTSSGTGGKKGTGTGTGSGGKNGGGGTMDASTTTDGGSTGMQPAPGCPGLLDCCATLQKAQQMNCELVANNADDASCDQYKTLVCPVADGGTVDPDACMTLNDCCESLPKGPVRVACATTVTNNVALDCTQVQEAFCPTGGDPNACTTLPTCCEGLPPPQRNSCNMIVDQGLPAACATVQMALCP